MHEKVDDKINIIQSEKIRKGLKNIGVSKIPFLQTEQIQILLDYFHQLNAGSVMDYGGFFNTSDSFPHEKNMEIHQKIIEIINDSLDIIFKDYEVHLSYYFVKPPSTENNTYPHQDWHFVEQSYPSYNLWIPLIPIQKDNGALGILHGSHHFIQDLNPAPAGSVDWSLSPYSQILMDNMTTYEMQAGEALIFYPNTIHSSLPNYSQQTRMALGMGISHKKAERILYFTMPNTNNKRIAKYKVPKHHGSYCGNAILWDCYNQNIAPLDSELLEVIDYSIPSVQESEVLDIIRQHQGSKED